MRVSLLRSLPRNPNKRLFLISSVAGVAVAVVAAAVAICLFASCFFVVAVIALSGKFELELL